MILKEKEVYQAWVSIHKDFPRVERLGIGARIESLFLDVLELTFASAYLSTEQKIPVLGRAIAKTDLLKFFLQLAWEGRLIHSERYIPLAGQLEEIGRMLGGWRRGSISKTPAP